MLKGASVVRPGLVKELRSARWQTPLLDLFEREREPYKPNVCVRCQFLQLGLKSVRCIDTILIEVGEVIDVDRHVECGDFLRYRIREADAIEATDDVQRHTERIRFLLDHTSQRVL